MKLRQRAMGVENIRECVDIVANHPVIGPRYGSAIALLPEAWYRLLQCEGHFASVIHADDVPGSPICFLGVAVVLQDEFVREMKTPPHFWVGPELTRRVMSGNSPVLTAEQLRDANSRDGLNLVVWEGCIRPGFEGHSELHRSMMAFFIEVHRGYLWKEVIASQAESPERVDFTLKTGGYLWDPVAGYISTPKTRPAQIVDSPHIFGITRELERTRKCNWGGSWVGSIFDYDAPVLGLSRSEQRLLHNALSGATDEELAGLLGASFPVVKKMWVSIYRRVEDCLPALIPTPSGPGALTSGHGPDAPPGCRGKEKRRSLLAYLRQHPEELRPFSRKVSLQAAGGAQMRRNY
jgi:hypothetical protein